MTGAIDDIRIYNKALHKYEIDSLYHEGGYDQPTIVSTDRKEFPTDFYLAQNYPNPFNPSTNIRYEVPKESFVSINIYDILGRLVRTLVNEEKPAGRYDITFNASKLSSGIYFYTIMAGDYTQTKKMLLLK